MSVTAVPPPLGIPVEQILAAAAFSERYGSTALRELAELRGDREPSRPSDVEVEPPRSPNNMNDEVFAVTADAASAFREAAQWLILVDTARARTALQLSADLFLQLGQPFGLFLAGMANAWWPWHVAMGDAGLQSLSSVHSGEGALELPMPAVRHPQQQAYLVVAAAVMPAFDQHERLDRLMEQSPHGRGNLPVGALGIPIHRFWTVAMQLSRGTGASVETIARHVEAIGRQYAEAIESAQVNEHLWRHAAAPVEVGDLDIVGIASLTAQAVGRTEALELLELSARGSGGEMLRALLLAGIEFGAPSESPVGLGG
jgi:hypothetical protein